MKMKSSGENYTQLLPSKTDLQEKPWKSIKKDKSMLATQADRYKVKNKGEDEEKITKITLKRQNLVYSKYIFTWVVHKE